MLSKCIFQIIGDTLKQFTLSREELENALLYVGSEEMFLRNYHKINIDDSQTEIPPSDDILIKRGAAYTDYDNHQRFHDTHGGDISIEIDDISMRSHNRTPSTASKTHELHQLPLKINLKPFA
jgi:hypothetical protein